LSLLTERGANVDWVVIASIAQTIEAIAVVAALLYAWQQVREARRGSDLGAMWEIFNELSSEEMNNARKIVYQNWKLYQQLGEGQGLDAIPTEARHNATKVANNLNRIGYVVHKGLIPEDLLLDNNRYVIARSWKALKPYVKHLRKEREDAGERGFMEYFEHLATRVSDKYDIDLDEIKFTT